MKSLALLRLAAPLFSAVAAAAHPQTLPAYQASVDPAEARILAQAPDLRQTLPPGQEGAPTCALSLRLIDTATRQPIAGLVRITGPDGVPLALPGLVNRGVKMRAGSPAKAWSVLLEPTVVPLPRVRVRIEAISGLETELAVSDLDLSGQTTAALALPLSRFRSMADSGWYGGNTHLHLKDLKRSQADAYLRTIPRGDRLELVFVSATQRIDADRAYISNEYTRADFSALSTHGVLFGNGEEQRNEFTAPHNTGYGHIMYLNIQRLIQPVSIGRTIMGPNGGPDYPPLRQGIDQVHAEGGTVIWCHGPWGHEQVPDWLSGRLNGLNIFDNGASNSYADTFYRFLDVGLKVPFSTGTDWYIYDFSRVYVHLGQAPTVSTWLHTLEAGRTFITNGPLLELQAGPHEIGDAVALEGPQQIPVKARAAGRGNFRRIQLVWNGKVVATAESRPVGGHFEAALDLPLEVKESGWLALRVGNGSADTGGSQMFPPELQPSGDRTTVNEMGEAIFGHTSPIYFEVAHRPYFRPAAARRLIEDMESSLHAIRAKALFDGEAQKTEVLKIYQDGISLLKHRLHE